MEIREKLAEFLAGRISLDDFKEWFIPATWDIEQSRDSLVYELVAEIHLKLGEFSNDHWTEDELRRLLRPLLESYSVTISFGSQSYTSILTYHSTASVIHHQQIADIVFSRASG